MTALRVLHAHSGNIFGGIESMLLALIGRRPELIAHDVVLAFDDTFAARLRAAGHPPEIVGDVRLSRPWTVRAARRKLARQIAARKPDVVVTHSAWGLAVFGPVARRCGRPLVVWAHAAPGRHMHDRLAKRTAPDRLICNSEFTRERFAEEAPTIPADVVYPAVPAPPAATPELRSAVRAQWGIAPETVVIAQVGRIERGKGQLELIEALSDLDDDPSWTCWEIGGAARSEDIRLARRLAQRVEELELERRIAFLGPRDDVPALLAAADLYAQPTIAPESFGITFIEALYAGLPIVATNIGGAREIVTDRCGILVPPQHRAALGEALRGVIRNRALRERLGSDGPARAAMLCDPDRQAEHAFLALRQAVD